MKLIIAPQKRLDRRRQESRGVFGRIFVAIFIFKLMLFVLIETDRETWSMRFTHDKNKTNLIVKYSR
jgi:hypothetical protein